MDRLTKQGQEHLVLRKIQVVHQDERAQKKVSLLQPETQLC